MREEAQGTVCREKGTRARGAANRFAKSSRNPLSGVEFRRTACGRVVRFKPPDDFDAVAVGVEDEEPVAVRDRTGLLHLDTMGPEVLAGGVDVRHAQREVPRASRVRLRLLGRWSVSPFPRSN